MLQWSKQQEKILQRWSEESQAYAYMHDREFKRYSKMYRNISLPCIIIGTIAGTANFSQGAFPAQYREYVSLVTGGMNLFCSLLTTTAQFLKIPENMQAHKESSISFSKFSRNIRVELSLPIAERSVHAREFINECRKEMEQMYERAPDISLKIVRLFGSRFKKKEFHMPSIIDLEAVDIYEDIDEVQNTEKKKQIEVEEAAKKLVEDRESDMVQLKDVSSGITDMLSSFRLAAESTEQKRISKGAGKQEDDLDAVADELV